MRRQKPIWPTPRGAFPIAEGYVLDLAAVVKAHRASAAALAEPDRGGKFRHNAVRTAIILARTEKA